MAISKCNKCLHILCGGDCVAWVDGYPYNMRGLVQLWGIQARQARKHLADGTKPRCADGNTVRRISDGKRLRPCARRGGRCISAFKGGRRSNFIGLESAAKALGVPRSSLHKIVRDPSRPIPSDWKCDALVTDKGIHYKPLRFSEIRAALLVVMPKASAPRVHPPGVQWGCIAC